MPQAKSFNFLRLPQVLEATGISKPTLYRLMKSGKFPKSYKLAERMVAWRDSEVRAWMESRLAA